MPLGTVVRVTIGAVVQAVRADADGRKDAGARVLWLGSKRAPVEVAELFAGRGYGLVLDGAAERPPLRVASLDLARAAARGARPTLEDRRVAVAHSDPGVADGMAQTVRALGGTAAVISTSELGLSRIAALQPHAALFDPADLHGEAGFALLQAVWGHPQLRWTPVLLTPSACFDASGSAEFDRMLACIEEIGASFDNLVESALAEECFEVPLSELGPVQTLRALVDSGGSYSAQFETPDLDINVDVAEGIIVGAQRQGDRETVLGPRALAILTRQVSGHVFVVRSERPGVTNIMAPIETALSSAATERSSWRPSGMPEPSAEGAPPVVVARAPASPRMPSSGGGMQAVRSSSVDDAPTTTRRGPPESGDADEEVTQVAELPQQPAPQDPEPTGAVHPPPSPAPRPQKKAVRPAATLLGMPVMGQRPDNDATAATPEKPASGRRPRASQGSLPKPLPATLEAGRRAKPTPRPAVGSSQGGLPPLRASASAADPPAPGHSAPASPTVSVPTAPGVVAPPPSVAGPPPPARPPQSGLSQPPPPPPVPSPPAPEGPALVEPGPQVPCARAGAPLDDAPLTPTTASLGQRLAAVAHDGAAVLRQRLAEIDWRGHADRAGALFAWARSSKLAWGLGGGVVLIALAIGVLSGDSEPEVALVATAAEPAVPESARPETRAAERPNGVSEVAAPKQVAAARNEPPPAQNEDERSPEPDPEPPAELGADEDDEDDEDPPRADHETSEYQRASDLVAEGNRLLRRKRFSQAEKAFEHALEILPVYPRALEGLTQVFLASHRGKPALSAARKLVQMRPGRARHHRLLGDAYAANMDIANAQRAWKRAARKGDRVAKKRLGM